MRVLSVRVAILSVCVLALSAASAASARGQAATVTGVSPRAVTTNPFDSTQVSEYAVQNLSGAVIAPIRKCSSTTRTARSASAKGTTTGLVNTGSTTSFPARSINFMSHSLSEFLVENNGDINIATGRIRKRGLTFLGDCELGNTGVGLPALNSVTTSGVATNITVDAGALQSWTKGALKIESFATAGGQAQAQSSSGEPAQAGGAQALAKQLSNPIASLISMPFQNNVDFNMGPEDDGYRYTMNFQPVIPIALNKNWNLISRTILPLIHQADVVGRSSESGLGDTIQSFFFSPNKSQPFIWGAGPVLLIPTATDRSLGTGKFGLGPTVVVLKQQGKWTYGALWNHIWSVAGKDDRADVNSTFLQPFLAHTTKTAWTFAFKLESTYDWKGNAWSLPMHLEVTKMVKFGTQPVSIGAGPRCWIASPAGGPQGCGFRFIVTPLFPKKG